MVFDPAIRITFLIVALGMQVLLHSFWFGAPDDNAPVPGARLLKRLLAWLFGIFALGSLVFAAARTWLQYQAWKGDPLNKFLLPPYAPRSYFINYVGSRLFAPLLVAILAGLLAGFAAQALNRRYQERFFEPEEPFIFALCVLSTGYPVFLFFILLIFLVGALWSGAYQFSGRGRAPLYYLWLPTAILAILIVHYFVSASMLASFNF
jgi:hypothetical protein